MTTYYLPDGENWWEIYEEAEKQYRNAQEQRGNISRSALGPRRISSYSTQSTRSPRLRPNALPADRYYLNYKLYYESRRFDERPEGITVNTTDPTMDHDLYGVDPIMELIKVKPQGSSNGPTRARIDGFSLKSPPLILETLKGSVILIFNNLIDLLYNNSTKPKFDPYKKIILFFW